MSKKLAVDKNDIARFKEEALQIYLAEDKKDMDPGEFIAYTYLKAANIFFKRLDTQYDIVYKWVEVYEPDDDRMG